MSNSLKTQRSLSATDAEWEQFKAIAEALGLGGPSALVAAVAAGSYRVVPAADRSTAHLQAQIDSLWSAIKDIRRQAAEAVPLGPTDLP